MKKGAGKFSVPRVIETPYLPEDVAQAMLTYANEIAGGTEPIEGIVGGIAGAMDKSRELRYSPNIPNWIGRNIENVFSSITKTPVTMMNDALLGALGEATYGAGRGHKVVAYITVGTGVGSALVTDGTLDHTIFGYETGHQIIDLDGSMCPECEKLFPGRKGELETLVGGNALRAQTGSAPKEVTDKSVWTMLADRLAAGVYNSILHWTPDVVVLGGSMILGEPAIPIDVVELKVKKRARPIMQFPAFKRAELGDFGVLHGAMAMVDKA